MESEFDVLGVPGTLVKYLVHSSKRKSEKNYFSSHKLSKLQQPVFGLKEFKGFK
jgi:hypothetical protein